MEELEFSMIDEMLEKAKKAQAEVENYTQEQVDALLDEWFSHPKNTAINKLLKK